MSEFGTGLTYCLGLFLKHAERYESMMTDANTESWFNAASDHLYEMQIPGYLPNDLRSRLETFQDLVIGWGHTFMHNITPPPTVKDRKWAILEAEHLLLEIDNIYGTITEEADWR